MTTTQTLSIAYSGPDTITDPYWIRIEQDAADETATISAAADLIDALFNIDPCVEADTETESNSLSLTSATPTTDLSTAIEETLDLSYCGAEPDGSVEVDIRIYRSHLDEPYTLRLDGGSVIKTVQVDGQVSVTQEISEEITLDYPVVSGFTCTPTPLSRTGNTVRFASDQVGHMLVAIFQSRWDAVTIKVDGIDGEPGECTALAFHHGVVAEHALDVPSADEADTSLCPSIRWKPVSESNQVTCYKDIIVSQRCKCSETEVGSYTYQQTVPCPDRYIKCPGVLTKCMHLLGTELVIERVDCEGDKQVGGGSLLTTAVSDPDYYRKICCQDPPFDLPQCTTRITTFKGELDIEFGRDYWRDLYGKNARFVPVPPPGGICGEWIIRQQIGSNNCCEGVPSLAWDTSVSPEVMAPNSAVIIGVTGGGKYPYRWQVIGQGFQFQNGSRSIETMGNQVRLSALVVACGTAIITVTDGCTSCTGAIRCTAGRWEVVGNFRPSGLYYNVIPGTYSCVTNSYSYVTDIPAVMYNGMFAMSPDHRGPEYTDPSDFFLGAGSGVHCNSSSCPEGFMAVDPLVGMFTWLACTQCHYLGSANPPYYRMFVTYPLGTNREFWIHKWVC